MKIVHIDIDSLRADHVGAYGYDADTTPNIDRIASEGVLFENSYVSNSPCMPSRAGTMTGRYGIHNGVETHGRASQTLNGPATLADWAGSPMEQFDDGPWWTLPEALFKNRIQTVGISSFPRHPAPWFYHVWHKYLQPQPDIDEPDFQAIEGEHVVDLAVDQLDRHREDELYLYIQLWDPHCPYNRSDVEIDEFRDVDLPPYPSAEDISRHQEWDAWRSAKHMDIESRDDLNEMLSHYDAEIHYADAQVGRVLATLRELGLYEETLVIVTGDHGEEFGEHGLYREHWSTHDGTQRVPLIVKPPSGVKAERGTCSELVTNVDIAPTIADYVGFDRPSKWQGQSLKPFVEGRSPAREHLVLDHGLYTAQRAVRTKRWKYIRTYHPGMWGGVVPEKQLYDMEADPWEQHDVLDDNEDVASELESVIADWTERFGGDDDPLQDVVERGPAGHNAFEADWDGV